MTQLLVKLDTIRRIEQIAGSHIIRGGDKVLNEALDILEKKIQELENK